MKVFFGLLLVLVIGFASCSIDESNYNVYDDDAAIMNNKDRYILNGSSQNNRGNTYSHRVNGSFTGLGTIRTIDGGARFEVDLSIMSGRFKLVLVGDNRVIMVTEENVNQVFEFPELSGTNYRLRMVGDGAKFNLEVKF